MRLRQESKITDSRLKTFNLKSSILNSLVCLALLFAGFLWASHEALAPIKYKLGTGDEIDFTAITKTNQGAGSGLDADKLDGLNSTAFLQSSSSASNTFDLGDGQNNTNKIYKFNIGGTNLPGIRHNAQSGKVQVSHDGTNWSDIGSAGIIVEKNDTTVASNISTLDFSSKFNATESPTGEANIDLASGGVTTAEIADGTIANADVSGTAAIAESKLALNNPTHSNANDPTAGEKAALAGTSGTPSGTNKYVTDSDARNTNARTPTAHKDTHKSGGSDALVVGDLLDATAKVAVRKNTGGVDVGARRRLNLIEGTNTTLTVTDDPTNEEVDITIASTSSGTGVKTLVDLMKTWFYTLNDGSKARRAYPYGFADEFQASTGIDSGASSNYSYRGTPNFDVVRVTGDALDENYAAGDDAQHDSVAGWDTYTKTVLHMNGTDASTTFTDEIGKTYTAFGNAQIDTVQSKFGGASGLFDGTGDYLTTPDHADWAFGSGNFTIDFWVRFNVASGNQHLLTQGGSGWHLNWNAGSLIFSVPGDASSTISRAWSPSVNVWYHVALVRQASNDWRFFIDGTQLGATYTGTEAVADGTGSLYVGIWSDGSSVPFNGWLDEIRISKGIARWTGNFTPPASEYTSSGTSLQIAQSFTPSANITLTRVELYLLKSGSADGNVDVRIETDNANKPSGTLAYTGASASITAASVGTTASYIVFDVTDGSLTGSTKYWQVLKRSSATTGTVSWRYDGTSPTYTGGDDATSSDSGTNWTVDTGHDALFKVYKQNTGNGIVVSTAGTADASTSPILVAWEETLGTGTITMEISRDGGTTWTTASTPTSISALGLKYKSVDVSAQPSGTSIKWKATIAGGAQLEACGVNWE